MKLLILVLTTLILGCTSRIPIQKVSTHLVISADKMNILFKDMDNPISIAIPNYQCNDLHISVSNGIIKGKGCKYSIHPQKIGTELITISSIKNNDTILLGQAEFRVKSIPLPKASLCNHLQEMSCIELKNCKGIHLFYPLLDYIPPYKITQFNLAIMRKNCIISRLESTQGQFNPTILNALQSVQSGDILYFEHIKIIHTKKKTVTVTDPDTHEEIDTHQPQVPEEINDLKIITR